MADEGHGSLLFVADPLGAAIDLSEAQSGKITVGNKASRAKELVDAISAVIREGYVDDQSLKRLRGRLMFSRSLCYGRLAGCALRALNTACTEHGARRRERRPLSSPLRSALSTLVEVMLQAPAWLVSVTYQHPWCS